MFVDTRTGEDLHLSSLQAILHGKISSGLIAKFPLEKFSKLELQQLRNLPFAQLAAKVVGKFFSDLEPVAVERACARAFSVENFDNEKIVKVVRVGENFFGEFWHGKTAAFKDVALSLLPELFSLAIEQDPATKQVLVLGATSGDTGSAGEAGFANSENVFLSILFPQNGRVSEIQKKQICDFQTSDGRISAFSILKNFDFCQNELVKRILDDNAFKMELLEKFSCRLSSLNSINIGRLAAQIVSFFAAENEIGQRFDVAVPTGNFGHALSAFLAKGMGARIGKIFIATNENDALAQFCATGRFVISPFRTTNSPSMDICLPSNFERLLFLLAGPERTRALFKSLQDQGEFTVDGETLAKFREHFAAASVNENETLVEIREFHQRHGRLLDPHSAIASRVARKLQGNNPVFILETAHWGKFPTTILESGVFAGKDFPESEIERLFAIEKVLQNENDQPLATKFLRNLSHSECKPARENFKPSAAQLKEILLQQLQKKRV